MHGWRLILSGCARPTVKCNDFVATARNFETLKDSNPRFRCGRGSKGPSTGFKTQLTFLATKSPFTMFKRAVVLAGGAGTRLWPYTVVLPKPLMPIGDYPILEVIIRQLVRQGFTHVTLAVNHQANILKAFFEDGNRWDVRIDYSLERKPRSTIAPLALISDLPENFLLMNGDVLTDLDLSGFLERHVACERLFTIAAARRWQQIDYGVLQIDS